MDELRLDLDRPIGTFALSGEEAAIRLRAKQRTIRRSAIELVRGLGFTGASVREEARKLEASMLGGEPYDWQAVNRAYLRKNRGRLLPNTYKTYESCLEKLARYFADLELADFEPPIGTERLEEFVDDLWGNSASRTRAKNISVLKGFFEWATLTGRLHGDPARPIKPPKKRGVERTIFSRDQETAILASNDRRDRLGLHLLLKVGIRKGELQGVQFRHFDHAHKRLTVFRKGGKVQTVPVVDPAFWDDLERHILDWSAQPNDYLLCRRSVRPNRHKPERSSSPSIGASRWASTACTSGGMPALLEPEWWPRGRRPARRCTRRGTPRGSECSTRRAATSWPSRRCSGTRRSRRQRTSTPIGTSTSSPTLCARSSTRRPKGESFPPGAPETAQRSGVCAWQESNLRPRAPEARALSPELQALGGQV